MINIYFKEGLEAGYHFYSFRSQEFSSEFTKFEYESQLESHLAKLKIELLMFNVEDFVCRFDEHNIIKNELQITATNRMIDFLNWCWESLDTPIKVFKTLKKMEPFIVDIVNSYSGENRQRAIMEWKLIVQFLDNELK